MTSNKRTFLDLKAQIEALQVEAEALRIVEVEAVLTEVRAKVAEYGLTEQDVFGRKRATRNGKSAVEKQPGVAKYRDPKTGATWSGKGRAPGWIAKARNRDRFLIEK
ncbi:MAG: H-NS histone family protein [Pseudomonadota bacterium]|jgi:DNA-binding protein H-NS